MLLKGNGSKHVFQKALWCVKVITGPLSILTNWTEGLKQQSIGMARLNYLAHGQTFTAHPSPATPESFRQVCPQRQSSTADLLPFFGFWTTNLKRSPYTFRSWIITQSVINWFVSIISCSQTWLLVGYYCQLITVWDFKGLAPSALICLVGIVKCYESILWKVNKGKQLQIFLIQD